MEIFRHLYFNGMWLGVYLRKNTKNRYITCSNLLVILDTTINIDWGSSCDQVMAPLLVVTFGDTCQFRVDSKFLYGWTWLLYSHLWINKNIKFTNPNLYSITNMKHERPMYLLMWRLLLLFQRTHRPTQLCLQSSLVWYIPLKSNSSYLIYKLEVFE